MAEPPSKRHKPPAGGVDGIASSNRGTVARVKLHNFMSYRDAEIVDPGSQLNCIVGPNGTGKSSIVCAMCVGLGGPLKLTARGDQISACVHGEGHHKDEQGNAITSGFVETELKDVHGPGQNLTVRLDFDVRNKKSWSMDGVATTERKVKETMDSLNIRVDNPLQFLPQDKVGEFSTMSPVDMLKHTEMAIGPDVYQQHLQLIDLDKELISHEQQLATEAKKLEDIERINRALEQDVERFRRLQENKRRLDNIRGKKLWAEYDFLRNRHAEMTADHNLKKGALKSLKEKYRQAASRAEPLERAKKSMEAKVKDANSRSKRADEERVKYSEMMDERVQDRENLESEMSRLDRKLEKLKDQRVLAEQKYDQLVTDLERARQTVREAQMEDPETRRIALKAAHDAALKEFHAAEGELRDHSRSERDVRQTLEAAQHKLHELSSLEARKMQLVKQGNVASAKLALWIDDITNGYDGPREATQCIGPLLMCVDVHDAGHQLLVEEALTAKYAYSFLALSTNALSALNKKVGDENWNVNINRFAGRNYTPCQRPPSRDMEKFGVTAWLDEAITIKPEHRDQVLGALKDLTMIDRYLLGTSQTTDLIEDLQAYLVSNGMDSVTICTPERTFVISRSRYGERLHSNTTRNPKRKEGLYKISADKEQLAEAEAAFASAKRHFDEHGAEKARLEERVEQANAAKNVRMQELQAFSEGMAGVHALERRMETAKHKMEKARQEEAAFDVGARRAELQGQLVAFAKQEAVHAAKVAQMQLKVTRASTEEYAAKLGLRAAIFQMAEAKDAEKDLASQVDENQQELDRLKAGLRSASTEAAQKLTEARKAAPQFQIDEATGLRGSPEDQAVYDALPKSLDELEAEIDSLEEDIATSDDDDGKTLRDYEQRCKEIEAAKAKLVDTQADVDHKRERLAGLVSDWKPQLEEMVKVVDANFSAYFERFGCVGHVELSDGRKLNQNGVPDGPDDFSAYKIHIKLNWRKGADLHVLGEGDSGGERSVATMIYLISLQSVNPAPFRVVDEINQAMDSTNERMVFECILHACKEGGKQYFLLTPKLLPDLDYGRETSIHLVLNGAYNVNRAAFNLAKYC